MMKRRLQFWIDYLQWTSVDWKTVIILDKSTYKLVRGGSKLVRRDPGSSRYDSKSTVNTVKYPESVMVWGVFSGNNGRWGIFFLCKNITLTGANYLEVLEQHMLPIWDIHKCHPFMHDGAPVRTSKLVKRFWRIGKYQSGSSQVILHI